MSKAFPYQLVGFLDKEPELGETVYSGKNGWYPQIALKRRFSVEDMEEPELLKLIEDFCNNHSPIKVVVEDEVKTDRMPVKVLEVTPTKDLISFHKEFIDALGKGLESRFPEREDGYYPHVTSEYNGKQVVNLDVYGNRTYNIDRVWLLKDGDSENSEAIACFDLKS